MYAVFETGGKQYKAEKGDIVFVEKLAVEPGKAVSFDALMIADGSDVMVGTPTVKGAKVKAKVVEHGKERKVVIFKYKSKKDYRKKQGHRQPFTKIEITGITTSAGKDAAEEVSAAAETKPAAKAAAKPAAAKPAEVKTTAEKAAAKPAAEKPAAKTAAAKPAAKAAAEKPAAKTTAAKPAAEKPAAAKKPAAKPAAAEPEKVAE
jgi:large subunit ribosomal protein L21